MKQYAVIGVGNFGAYLAKHETDPKKAKEMQDEKPDPIQEIKDDVSHAVVADATDRKAMESIGLKQMDAAVVCIGSVLSNSILATLNLKEMGIKHVLAKAMSEAHGRILHKIGASEVFFPEKDMAITIAERLHNPSMLDYLPFIEGYSIVELAPPDDFIGKSLQELDLINRYGIQVVAVKEIVPDRLNLIPTAGFVVKDSDIIIMLGPNESLEKLREGKR